MFFLFWLSILDTLEMLRGAISEYMSSFWRMSIKRTMSECAPGDRGAEPHLLSGKGVLHAETHAHKEFEKN